MLISQLILYMKNLMKDIKIFKYTNIYPSTLFIVDITNKNPKELLNYFYFMKNDGYFTEESKNIEEDLKIAAETAICGVYPVVSKEDGEIGCLIVIFSIEELDTSTIAHESVHAADYYYQRGNMLSQDFSDGNEPYAYLCGWIAGKIANVQIELKHGKSRKEK